MHHGALQELALPSFFLFLRWLREELATSVLSNGLFL